MNLPNKKAIKLEEIDSVLQFNAPLSGKGHAFYTDFTGLRGDFKEKRLYRTLNLNPSNLTYNYEANQFNKLKVFLAGMRGSGKTTELARIVQEIEHKDAFLCVVCNIDIELNMDHVEYMDILICQIENLIKKAQEKGVQLDSNIVRSLSKWFEERTLEVNSSLELSDSIDIKLDDQSGLSGLLSLVGRLKGGVTGSKERADSVRKVFRNRFGDFAQAFNIFVEDAARLFRDHSVARDILFIVDGLEKTTTAARRREIIIENAESIKSIRANWLMTLPIELMKSIRQVKDYSEVITFPFIKIQEQNGANVEATINRFVEFVYKRVDKSLFESEEVVKTAVRFSGGSPRELLRLLQHASYELADNDTQITMKALMEAVKELSADARFLSDNELSILKEIKDNNKDNKPTPFKEGIEKLLEEIVVMEYDSGTYKRVNPIIEYSTIYKTYVKQQNLHHHNIIHQNITRKLSTVDNGVALRLASLKIRNFRGIKELNLDVEKKSNFIFVLGENGYGKTSILQSIILGFLGNIDQNKILINDRESQEASIEITYFDVDKEEHISFEKSSHRYMTAIFGYGSSRLSIQNSESKNEVSERSSKMYGLFFDNNNMLDIEYELSSRWDKNSIKYQQTIALLKNIIPNIVDIKINSNNDVEYFERSNPNEPLQFNQLSAASKNNIALIGDLIIKFFREYPEAQSLSDFEGFVLIDEFELHLHPNLQRKLPKLLADTFPKVQFIISTHSVFPILGAPQNSTYIKVYRDEKNIWAEQLDIDPTNLTPNILFTSPLFDMDNILSINNEDPKKVDTADSWQDMVDNNEVVASLKNFQKEKDKYSDNLFL